MHRQAELDRRSDLAATQFEVERQVEHHARHRQHAYERDYRCDQYLQEIYDHTYEPAYLLGSPPTQPFPRYIEPRRLHGVVPPIAHRRPASFFTRPSRLSRPHLPQRMDRIPYDLALDRHDSMLEPARAMRIGSAALSTPIDPTDDQAELYRREMLLREQEAAIDTARKAIDTKRPGMGRQSRRFSAMKPEDPARLRRIEMQVFVHARQVRQDIQGLYG
jgi:hypothetical protein